MYNEKKPLINYKALVKTVLTFAIPIGGIWLAIEFPLIRTIFGYGAMGLLILSLFAFIYMMWDNSFYDSYYDD